MGPPSLRGPAPSPSRERELRTIPLSLKVAEKARKVVNFEGTFRGHKMSERSNHHL